MWRLRSSSGSNVSGHLSLRYDLRAPAFGPPIEALYAAMLDQCVWAEEQGFGSVGLSAALRVAWSGEEFEYRGRRVRVTPRPLRPRGPHCSWAAPPRARPGGPPASATASSPSTRRCGRSTRRPAPSSAATRPAGPAMGPQFVHVADDPDAAWARIAPHALHETKASGEWLTNAEGIHRYTPSEDAAPVRSPGGYAVLTPEECVERARAGGGPVLHPLMGGLPPDLAWESLELIAAKVLPALREPA